MPETDEKEIAELPAIADGQAKMELAEATRGDVLLNDSLFETMQRAAKLFAASHLVPKHFQGNIPDCFIAIHMARNLHVDPFTLMQNCYVVSGRPGIEGKLVIALINNRGPYVDGVKYVEVGDRKADTWGYQATGRRTSGEVDYGPMVTVKQAKELGWWKRNPNWAQLTELMLKYRAATYLARTQCPEVLMGLQTTEELKDVHGTRDVRTAVTVIPTDANVDSLNEKIAEYKREVEQEVQAEDTVEASELEKLRQKQQKQEELL